MPLTVHAAARLADWTALNSLTMERVGSTSKNLLLPEARILLPWLADCFVSPPSIPYRFVFSLGDILVAAGTLWLLLVGQPVTAESTKSGDA